MADSLVYRRKFFAGNVAFLAILVLILIALYLLRDVIGGAKVDLTDDQIYTISPETKKILSGLIDRVTVNYYVSEKLPGRLQTLKRDTKDMFDEFHDLSNEKFQYSIIDPEEKAIAYADEKVKQYDADKAAGKTPTEPEAPQNIQQIFGGRKPPSADEIRASRDKLAQMQASQQQRNKDDVYRDILTEEWKRNYFQKLEEEGIASFPVQERDASSVRQLRIFSAMEIKYLTKQPEIIPVHYQMESLEYEIASRVRKLTTSEKPIIAFFDGRKAPSPPMNPMNPAQPPPSEYEGIINFLNEQFDVDSMDLKEGSSIDDLVKRRKEDRWRKANEEKDEAEKKKEMDEKEKEVKPGELREFIKCLVVAQPDGLEPRQVYEINRAVSAGVPTIFLVGRYSMDVSRRGLQTGLPIAMISPGVDDLFKKWGIEVGTEILASNESGSIEMPTNIGGLTVMMARPLAVNVASTQDSLSQSSVLTNRIQHVIFPATTGMKVLGDVLKKNGLTHEVLAKTEKETWSTALNPFERRDPFNRGMGGLRLADYREELVGLKNPEEFRDFIDPMPLAVLVQGKFPFTFEGETIPAWKKEDKDKDQENPHAGLNIPGIPGLPGDRDLALNAVDPQDAKPAEAKPADAKPAEAPAPAQPPASVPPAAETPTQPPAAGAAPAEAPPQPGAPTPAPSAEPKAAEAKPAEKASLQPADNGSILVLSSVDMMKNDYLLQQSQDYQSNIRFFQNAVERFGLGTDLIEIRRKQLTVRAFKPGSDKASRWIQWLNIAGVPALVGALGLVYFLVRRAGSISYERSYIQKHS